MTETVNTTFATTDIDGLAEIVAYANEELGLGDLHPAMADRYRGIAAELVSQNLPRDLHPIAAALAVLVDGIDHKSNAPWAFGRHMDAAEDALNRY